MMRLLAGLGLLVLVTCCTAQHQPASKVATSDQYKGAELEEYFSDSLHIGRKGHNKIEMSLLRTKDRSFVIINFFTRQNGCWVVANHYELDKDDVLGMDPELSDFNNDGLNDMTYVSAVAARGANEVRRLFIYNKSNDRLMMIENSDDYPNLRYNKRLHCLDAFLVYGGCSTVFLRIEGDSLKEFACVELANGLSVTTYDRHGKEKIIYTDTTNKAEYVRYINFQPLEVNDEEDSY